MIVDPSGLVVTNYHVINGMTQVKVALSDRREFEAEIVLRDPRTDLAVLRIKGGDHFPFMELGDSDALEVGDFVIAIGDPFGVGQTVTQGIVSALARTQIGASDYGFFIQTDAAINPGNSGGALVDLDGKLVGINSMIYSRSGGSMGLGFAIPVNMVKGVVAAALHGGRPSSGRGSARRCRTSRRTSPTISGSNARPARSWSMSWRKGPRRRRASGAATSSPRSTASRSTTPRASASGSGSNRSAASASLKVLRDGKTLELPLKLASAPEIPARDALTIHGRSPFAGAEVMNLSPAVKEELSLKGANAGRRRRRGRRRFDGRRRSASRRATSSSRSTASEIATTRELEKACAERAQWWDLTIQRGEQTIRTQLGG